MSPDLLTRIDDAIRRDPGGRGVARLERANPLAAACESLLEAGSVLLVSGFPYLDPSGEGPVPETDGPIGSLALAEALRELGAEVAFVTDPCCRELFEELEALPLLVPDLVGLSDEALRERLDAVLEMTAATHLVAIERPGRDAEGLRRNARGVDLEDASAPLDELFLMAPERNLSTLAIGDGGNEIGMGSLSETERAGLYGGPGGSVIPADHLLVAGVSDWGAYGLLAALSARSGRDLLPEPRLLEEWMRVMLEMGAVDGITGEDAPTVDGVPLAESIGLVKELRGMLT